MPVLASGGIADAKGVAAAMALGTAGVQIGTAWEGANRAAQLTGTAGTHRCGMRIKAFA